MCDRHVIGSPSSDARCALRVSNPDADLGAWLGMFLARNFIDLLASSAALENNAFTGVAH